MKVEIYENLIPVTEPNPLFPDRSQSSVGVVELICSRNSNL